MKWRTTAVYFLVLLLIGSIYLVIDSRKKESVREEKEARRVFVFDPAKVKEIEIKSGEAETICLEKGDRWRISRPVASDVDWALFSDLFSALRNLEQERKIGKPSDNLSAFGLDKPSLTVRLLTGDDWLELRMGGENPAQTARYAIAGKDGDVFMVSSSTYTALNKSLRDLRRKNLFAWQPDQVSAIDVKWQGGDEFSLERQGSQRRWKCASQPEFEIKSRKVENLLDDLHWLRAADFVAKDAMTSPAQLSIRIKLKDGKTSELEIANPDDAKKKAVANCSEIEGPVLVASNILGSVPRSLVSLADLSLISADGADIRKITWKTGNGGGNLVWMDRNSWGSRQGEGSPKAAKDQEAISRFLAFIEDAEFLEIVKPGSNPPEGTHNNIQFEDVFGKKGSLTWDVLPAETAGPVTVWMEREGGAREVRVKYEVVKRLDEYLAQMGAGIKTD